MGLVATGGKGQRQGARPDIDGRRLAHRRHVDFHAVVLGDFSAIFNDRGSVVASAVKCFRMANDQGYPVNAGCQIVKSPLTGPVKIGAQQQIFRGIATDRQLRRQEYLRTAGLGLGCAGDDTFDVARQVSDNGIELGNGNPQHGLLGSSLITGNAFHDFLLSGFNALPTHDLDPLAGFQILVVLEEMGDLLAQQLRLMVAWLRRKFTIRSNSSMKFPV